MPNPGFFDRNVVSVAIGVQAVAALTVIVAFAFDKEKHEKNLNLVLNLFAYITAKKIIKSDALENRRHDENTSESKMAKATGVFAMTCLTLGCLFYEGKNPFYSASSMLNLLCAASSMLYITSEISSGQDEEEVDIERNLAL